MDVVQTRYAGHHGWLGNWLNKRLGNMSDAADLTQDTFTRILEARRKPGAQALRLQEPRVESQPFLNRRLTPLTTPSTTAPAAMPNKALSTVEVSA